MSNFYNHSDSTVQSSQSSEFRVQSSEFEREGGGGGARAVSACTTRATRLAQTGGVRAQGTPFQRTTRRPSPCGCPARAHKGLSPREDHASNLVGLVRDIIGLLGWRRPFRAVRHIGQKWTTCTPGMLYKASWVPQSRRARSARTSPPQRARAARASEGV